MNVRIRGAVMVETALFVSATLVFMLGTIQIGVLGFLQLTTDAAAYYDARANVLTVSHYTSPEAATNNAFRQIPATDMHAAVVPAPTPSIPVDYGYNDPDPNVRANSAVQRHGGASMMQPAQEQVTVTLPPLFHMLGQALGVTGVVIEPVWQECGTHFDIANVGCSLAPSSSSQTNYFTAGENTPPYLVGFNYTQQCSVPQPWGVYTGGLQAEPDDFNNANNASQAANSQWTSNAPCANGSNNGNSSISFIAMGSAEYLDNVNWSDNSTGVSGPCDTSGGKNQSAFEAMAYHQRVYATIATYLTLYPNQSYVEKYSQEWDSANDLNQYGSGNHGGVTIGRYATGTGAATPENITTFENWEGFDDSSNGPGGGSDIYNDAVQKVYAWDVPVSAGAPPNDPTYNNPTTPEKGCYP